MKNVAYVLVLAFFAAIALVAATSRSEHRDPETGLASELGSYRAVITYTVDQHYGGWGISSRSRPNLRGIAYADDLGVARGAGLQMCSTDYHHSMCVWDVRIPFSRRTRHIQIVIQEQLGALLMRDWAANVTVDLNNMFTLHILDSRGPFVRGGRLRYEADRATLHLPSDA